MRLAADRGLHVATVPSPVHRFIMAVCAKKVLFVNSVVRGHHVYKDVWTPFIGEELTVLREPENEYDCFAVSIILDGSVVGCVPKELSRHFSRFLLGGGEIMCEITGRRRKGKGLEVPCVYKLRAENPQLVKKLQTAVKRYTCT